MVRRTLAIVLFASVCGIIRCLFLPGGIPLFDPDSILGGDIGASDLEIGMEELLDLLDQGDLMLVDARNPDDFFEGCIPGAVNLPFMEFEDFIDDFSADLSVASVLVLYCTDPSCDLAERLAGLLHGIGLDGIRLFPPGVEGWEEAGFPLEY